MSPRGDKHPILMIPGFLAGDTSLRTMRNFLRFLGYRSKTWGFGRNTGQAEYLLDHLPELLNTYADYHGEKVSLIGQSLGGVFARELAREYPDLVRQVITLGSPFSIRSGTMTMSLMRPLFKRYSGSSVEEMLTLMDERDATRSPDVPLTAIYSKSDGVVHWQSCREHEEDHQTENIEVAGSHCGMGFNAMIYHIVADRLAQNPESWQRYKN